MSGNHALMNIMPAMDEIAKRECPLAALPVRYIRTDIKQLSKQRDAARTGANEQRTTIARIDDEVERLTTARAQAHARLVEHEETSDRLGRTIAEAEQTHAKVGV
jgi:septal ring factor EnvC (AmiA/AmiB activator)